MILTSWNPIISRGTTLALMGALFLGMIMQLSVLAQEAQVEVRDWLEQTFPELRGKVTGDNYPPPPIAELLMKFLSVIQLAGMAVALMGENVFRFIGMSRPPSWYGDIVVKNAVPLGIGLYLIVPQILNGYIVSNAFEVVLDGTETIFSKIATGRMPAAEDLIDPLTRFGLLSVGVAPK
ncbi:hypothetical protein FRACYDRAFT_262474 [Fragilariopsis cylindrus CCMP1102]|uniref:Uncharacterized protein n=1 Tax=Fragilariopsis cylindrus CCMP1102 TaxID=635003 RepID=A0A1E7F791_9STRA|nr:hypothetical protein FRACYDRAFT_262474 [Fragilariopsis cylindrus CCMP1102]|eukprot:OEU14020.1 hypothetical protein FRACYDRAFT_262474 [Fragilariopsis cylindrus CCMP1102]